MHNRQRDVAINTEEVNTTINTCSTVNYNKHTTQCKQLYMCYKSFMLVLEDFDVHANQTDKD